MMLSSFRIYLSAVLLVAAMSGCSLFKDKPPEYVLSRDGAPLTVPEDLDELTFVRPVEISVPPMRMPSGDELNPGPPRAVATGGRADANAFMAWSAAGVYLQVKDSPESVARRLGFAIERSGMRMIQRDPDGAHQFEYFQRDSDSRGFFERMMFWRSDQGPNYSGSYRTHLQSDGEQTRVYLMYGNGSPADTGAAEHVLGIFMDRLG
jgi:uncharacterized lipoprotein